MNLHRCFIMFYCPMFVRFQIRFHLLQSFFTGVNYLLSFLHCVFESRDGSMIVYARQTRRRTFEGSYLPCNMLKDLVIMLYQNLTTRKFSIVVQLYVPTPFIHITCVQLFQNYACRFVAQSLTRTHPYSLTFSLV